MAGQVIAAMKALETGLVPMAYPMLALGLLLAIFGAVRAWRDMPVGRGGLPAGTGIVVAGLALAAVVWASGFEVRLGKPVIYMFAFATAVWLVMNYTNIGRRLYAVGGNPEAARLSGINVTHYKLLAFALCSATAGFAGILFASRLRSVNPNAMQGLELTVIAAAILGGTSLFGGKGSVAKSVAGAMLLYTLTNGFNIVNLGANYQGFVEGVVVIAAAAIYTVGGARGRRG